ncbi:(d)CMP kinase [Teredinibacter purpureus]|uniref:(d)CMP kinase n=1 Tax=Teredinibacter purpureus TaxID=2731756 RepID=UPI0005F83C57|nr:(d)CMP kinase [Teredinibacter purpureus]
MQNDSPVITIDGPSGSGKGTLCRLVAQATGYSLLDSGALYRLTALAAVQSNTNLENEQAVAALAQNLAIEFRLAEESICVMLGSKEVTDAIRQEEIGMLASTVAAYPQVREALLTRQRDFRQAPGLVADGRDMGTVVFPEAPLKIFLTASAQERANRRVKQLALSGAAGIDPAKILADIEARDDRDTNRASSPLKPASDAIVLDSTSLSINAVFNLIMNEVSQRALGA